MEKKLTKSKKRGCCSGACIKKWCLETQHGRHLYRCYNAHRKLLTIAKYVAISVLVSWLSLFGIMYLCFYETKDVTSGSWGDAGTVGDMFGLLNALFAGLSMVFSAVAFLGFLLALWMQRQDLNLQRKEMSATRGEMQGQTTLITRQVEIGAIQSLYAALPSYEAHLASRWKLIPSRDSIIEIISDNNKKLVDSLHELLTGESLFSGILPEVRSIYGALNDIDKNLKAFMPWAEVVYRWSEKVDRYISNEQDRIDVKKNLLLNLSEQERNLLWLCHLANGRFDENYNITYLDFDDFYSILVTYEKLHSVSSRGKMAAIQIISTELRGFHEMHLAPIERQVELRREFSDKFQDRLLAVANKVPREG